MTARAGKIIPIPSPINLSLVRYFITLIKIDAGNAILVINEAMLPPKESANQLLRLKMYPNAMIKTISTTLDTDVKNTDIC